MQIRIDLSSEKKFVTKTANKLKSGIATAKDVIRHRYLYQTNALYRLLYDTHTIMSENIKAEEALTYEV